MLGQRNQPQISPPRGHHKKKNLQLQDSAGQREAAIEAADRPQLPASRARRKSLAAKALDGDKPDEEQSPVWTIDRRSMRTSPRELGNGVAGDKVRSFKELPEGCGIELGILPAPMKLLAVNA